MPRPLTSTDTPNSLDTWLSQNISNLNTPFTPHVSPINSIPEKRGVYLWFMSKEGYSQISQYVRIDPIETWITWEIEGEGYDLVYLGTAGTKRSGLQTLQGRLKWHINQEHNNTSICHGTLSTLRTGLAALLSEDLIVPNTESLVNKLIEGYFKVFWIEYSEDYFIDQINQDEDNLIKILRPLFNLKVNPNAKIPLNPTWFYKKRRNLIEKSTKTRLGCTNKEGNFPKKEKGTPKTKPVTTQPGTDCIEFNVKHTETIHEKIQGLALPIADKYEITISNLNDRNHLIYNGKSGNPKKYFNNIHSNNVARWKHIQHLMNEQKIKNAVVRVCPLSLDKTVAPVQDSTNPKRTKIVSKSMAIQELEIRKDDIIVMCCAGRKNILFQKLIDNGNEIDFRAVSNPLIYQVIPDDLKSNDQTWRNYIAQQQANMNLNIYKAYELYTPYRPFQNIYIDLHSKFTNRLYILSAGWGLIRSDYRIPIYDITFKSDDISKKRSQPNATFDQNDWKQLQPQHLTKYSRIILIGSPKYHKLFDRCTAHLNAVKIKTSIDLVRGFQGVNNRNWIYNFAKQLL